MAQAEAEARRAANRLRRALEKAHREIDALEGALARAEGDDFPGHAYEEARGGSTRWWNSCTRSPAGCNTRSSWREAWSRGGFDAPPRGMDERHPAP